MYVYLCYIFLSCLRFDFYDFCSIFYMYMNQSYMSESYNLLCGEDLKYFLGLQDFIAEIGLKGLSAFGF